MDTKSIIISQYRASLRMLELQFNNIRHLQQHIGELCERLWVEEQIEIDWVGMQPIES